MIRRTSRPAALRAGRRRRRTASAGSRSRTAASGRSRCARACAAALRPVRRIDRLQGQAHMIADDLRRRDDRSRHLRPHAAPGLAGAPEQGRQPGEAGLDQHHLQLGELLEHALGEEADELALEGGRLRDVVLDPVRGPAGRVGAADRCCRHGCRSAARASRPPRRSASRCGARAACRPSPSSSTWTKRRSFATRSISATAACGSCSGTRIEARSRGSRSSNSLATQSFTARQSAAAMSSLNSATAPCSVLQIAKRVPNGRAPRAGSCRDCRRARRSAPRQSGRALSGEFGG